MIDGSSCLQGWNSHAVAVRANMRSILVAMMKSFSCSPWIFFGLQRDRYIAPAEADVRMMAFSFPRAHQSPEQM